MPRGFLQESEAAVSEGLQGREQEELDTGPGQVAVSLYLHEAGQSPHISGHLILTMDNEAERI